MRKTKDYHFLISLRIFSLAVAVVSVGLGVRLGWDAANPQYGLAILLLLGGVLAQAGINLINDVEDLRQADPGLVCAMARNRINQNQRRGWIAFGIASLIGLYLVTLRGWPLLAIFVLSAALALNYNAGPLNFKHGGLAIIQVFVLMGLIMVEASYFVMTGQFSSRVLWLAIPISLLISLLLLSNEIRDVQQDTLDGIQTLTVRIGLTFAQKLYWGLIASTFLLIGLYAALGWINIGWLSMPTLLMLPLLKTHLYADKRDRLTPLSARFFLLLGILYLWMVKPITLL